MQAICIPHWFLLIDCLRNKFGRLLIEINNHRISLHTFRNRCHLRHRPYFHRLPNRFLRATLWDVTRCRLTKAFQLLSLRIAERCRVLSEQCQKLCLYFFSLLNRFIGLQMPALVRGFQSHKARLQICFQY